MKIYTSDYRFNNTKATGHGVAVVIAESPESAMQMLREGEELEVARHYAHPGAWSKFELADETEIPTDTRRIVYWCLYN